MIDREKRLALEKLVATLEAFGQMRGCGLICTCAGCNTRLDQGPNDGVSCGHCGRPWWQPPYRYPN